MTNLNRELPTNRRKPSGSAGLYLLADWLKERVEDPGYCHEHFTSPGVMHANDLLNTCGTSACALGHVPTIPQFQKRGWRLRHYCGDPGQPLRGRCGGSIASARVEFGITRAQYSRVFGFQGCVGFDTTRTEIIAAIRKLADELRADGR